MGADTPLAVLSGQYQPLFNYFRQMFAQVTNPPIDALREKIVTSTAVYAGKNGNLLQESADNCHVLKIENPILSDLDLLKIKAYGPPRLQGGGGAHPVLQVHPHGPGAGAPVRGGGQGLPGGGNILILTDRGVDENHVAIPSLLAVSAVHKHLVKTKKCTALSLILESGEPREVHHFATLLGYGACAVNPYLAHASLAQLVRDGLLNKDYYAAVADYDNAVLQGIVKIASKMGISTLQSYQGSQIFEALGISRQVIDAYFTGTVSRIGGITLADIAAQTDAQHSRAFDPLGLATDLSLPSLGRTSCAARARCTAIPPRSSTFCSRPPAPVTMRCSSATPKPRTPSAAALCAACWTSTGPPKGCLWRKWRARRPSCAASRPGPCPTAPSPRRPTRLWPWP